MKNTGWKTLMLRGTEWAATGAVSISVPYILSDEKPKEPRNYSWIETDTTFALLDNEDIVWQYNFNTIKGKPFFHPVNINNSTISWLSPENHPWHLGIWHSWKFINGVNYWEYDQREGVAPFNFLGVSEVRNIKFDQRADFSCIIYLDIYYHEKSGPDLLMENRIVHVSSPDEKSQFFINYEFDLSALVESVELNRTPLPHEENGKNHGGYAGLSVRFSQDLFDPTFINSDGSLEMNHGKPYPWRYYGLRNIKGIKVGTAIFSDAENLNYPEPWFVTNTEDHPFYYFSPAPIFNQPHVMEKDEQLKLKYRMQFYTDEVCLAWAHQRENHGVGYVTLASRSENIESNLKAATEDALSQEKFLAINGDGSDENPGINANNRLIWGQVFFWPEARVFGHDKDVLWNDTQVFETKADYSRFRNAVGDFYRVWKETTVDLPIKYQS